jgi:hypothetical protein|tara:strand:- start:316 stop:483 length:168 start_codon:yes stop_codon:yes gene_type:complete
MLLAVYKNKKYKTINVPLSMKAEIEQMLKERGIEWYTMSYSEGEKEDVKFLEECN